VSAGPGNNVSVHIWQVPPRFLGRTIPPGHRSTYVEHPLVPLIERWPVRMLMSDHSAGRCRAPHVGWAGGQLRKESTVSAKALGLSIQGKWPASDWTVTVESGNTGAACLTTAGATMGSRSPA
jgi:hypothetical protein